MKYLKYFESTSLDTNDVKDKIDYMSQALIDDYDGISDIGLRKLRQSRDSTFMKVEPYSIVSDYFLHYRLKLNKKSILTEDFLDKTTAIYKDPSIDVWNREEVELPHSKYQIEKNDGKFMLEYNISIASSTNKYLSECEKESDFYKSCIFRPEFISELKKLCRGIRHEFDKRTKYGEVIQHYSVGLHDITETEAAIIILLY